jgi:hypothetical protein
MLGTLQNPPIILAQDRVKLSLLLIAGIGFVALILTIGIARSVFLTYAGLVLFGLGSMLVAWSIVRPATIVLDQSGIAYRSRMRTVQYEWQDFAEFFIWSPRWPVKFAGFVYSETSRRDRIGRAINGGIGSFGGSWELPVSEMVDLLNQAHGRWGSRN